VWQHDQRIRVMISGIEDRMIKQGSTETQYYTKSDPLDLLEGYSISLIHKLRNISLMTGAAISSFRSSVLFGKERIFQIYF